MTHPKRLTFAQRASLGLTLFLIGGEFACGPKNVHVQAPVQGAPAASTSSDWKQIPIPPLPSFHPQEPKRIQLPNGMVIFLQEDHELPLIRGTARIRGGSREEPADKAGLVQIYGQVLRIGGTKSRTGDQLDDFLEARAARVESGGGLDSVNLIFDCLKERLDDVFPVFVDLLRDPEFRADKIPVAQRQIDTGISRRNDDAEGIASREASKLGYGADSPYAREPEYATVAAVTREDLLNWHRAYVHPNNIILGIEGDFDSKAMEARLRSAFESWPKGSPAKTAEASFNDPKAGVYFISKDDATQSQIRMVGLGIRRDNPDYFAVTTFDEIFGGGFSSRLVQNVRSKKGLAYEVGGGIGAAFDHPGMFQISMGTKSGTTAAAIDALNAEIDGLKTNPPSPEELKKAKDSILNSFVFQFDTPEKVLAERMAYEFYGYPADFLERYQAGIEHVTLDDVKRVAGKYIHKDRMAILVVGKASDFDRPLSSFGTVTALDITIPQPGGAKTTAAASGSNAEGKALVSRIVEEMGGQAKIKAIKSVRVKLNVVANTPQGEMPIEAEVINAFPDRSWQKMGTPMGEMMMVLTPHAAFMATPQGTQDLPDSRQEDAMKDLRRDPVQVAQHLDDPKYVFSAGGQEKIGDVATTILDVNAAGATVRWYVDPKTGRVIRASWQGMGMQGPAETVADYDDWKSVDGISLPFKETRTENGEKTLSVEIKEVQFNPTFDPKIFEKPAGSGGAQPK
ncbi:MAG TPA: insulinase family protein [Terriglobia bacterium]|nr:insulinase family protein [Terriglobia bacterium]